MKTERYAVLTGFVAQHRYSYIAGFLLMLVASFSQSWIPTLLGSAIDCMKVAGFSQTEVLKRVISILAVTLIAFLLTYLWRTLIIGNARKMECVLRGTLYRKLETLPPEFYSSRKTGDLMAYAINDISAIRMAFGPATAMSVNGFILCASSIFFMVTTIDFTLTMMTLLPIPAVTVFMIVIGRKIQDRFRTVQKTFGEISDRVQENINGIRVIKAYVQERREITAFQNLNNRMMDANIRLVAVSATLTPVIEICFSLSFCLNLVLGGALVLKGSISLGDFVAFNTYLAMIMAPIISIGKVISSVHKGLVSLQRIHDILGLKPTIDDEPGSQDLPVAGSITIENLSFTYPGATHPALRDIGFTIREGESLGIIGRTGSGKTTLAGLLLRLYDTNRGSIRINGLDIHSFTLSALRRACCLVPQDGFLFQASVSENIASFKTDVNQTQIEKAARAAEIHESIMALPDGYRTALGERGINLSGGQRQRISIARALVRDPAVLILDDALSAVDALTEAKILSNLEKERSGKTTIIIAHRVSSIAGSREIIVLDRGRIAERGEHAVLLASGGLYASIAAEQARDTVNHEI